jgi:hypothetical protein
MMWIVASLVVAVAALTMLATASRLPAAARFDRALRQIPNWIITLGTCFVLVIGSILVFDTPGPGLVFLALGAVVMFAMAWLRDFAYLMTQPDHAFPGRHDKLIWAMLLTVLPPVGVLAFWSYRRAQWNESRVAKPTASRDWL